MVAGFAASFLPACGGDDDNSGNNSGGGNSSAASAYCAKYFSVQCDNMGGVQDKAACENVINSVMSSTPKCNEQERAYYSCATEHMKPTCVDQGGKTNFADKGDTPEACKEQAQSMAKCMNDNYSQNNGQGGS